MYIINFFKRIGRYLNANRIEPHVKSKCDCRGNCYWQVYDPVSGYNGSFGSEKEVRAWLDCRYYN